jgi:MoxR-like ATPase
MKSTSLALLPAAPLLRAYVEAGPLGPDDLVHLPGLGPRFAAIRTASRQLLDEQFLDSAGAAEFQTALVRFYEACVQPALHVEVVRRRAGALRHALGHLRRCADPLPRKAERCLDPSGPYHVTGLGPAFWSALFQALTPDQNAGWTPDTAAGLRRLGLSPADAVGPGAAYAAVLDAYRALHALQPGLTAQHLDHFLTLAGTMQGRDLWSGTTAGLDLAAIVRRERARLPLRQRLKQQGRALQEARRQLEAGAAADDGPPMGAALAVADPAGARRAPVDWPAAAEALALWVGRLWEADDPYEALDEFWAGDPVPGAGLWLPAAVLHLRDPRRFQPWNEAARSAFSLLDYRPAAAGPPAAEYRLFNEGIARLCEQHRVHALEAPAVLAAVGRENQGGDGRRARDEGRFGGFCADTFRFLGELTRENSRAWMDGQRDRYRFAVRGPLIELCRALAERYVGPVLRYEHGWDLETEPRNGLALTSIVKNDYGRSQPYNSALWITFYRRGEANAGARRRGAEAQLFVRLDAAGLSYGFRLGREAREAGGRFRRRVQEHGELLYHALCAGGAFTACRLAAAEDLGDAFTPAGVDDLRAWAAGKTLLAARRVAADDALLMSDELVGDILLTFDRLLPAFACAAADDPLPLLHRRAGALGHAARYTDADFRRATFLDEDWLHRARALLGLKKQLILQGVPGTGKTHVARCLARLLTAGRDEAVRLVQFHPAYSYEEFVEGIKVRSVEANGRHEVTYPVEEGLLCAFAAEAARSPAEPFVLIIDEINRGNLPRVFGELLYLLEYRGQSVELPYSRRDFRLPDNLYLLATMNAADRSVALVDQALRRRFSFLEMPPAAAVLAAWLAAHPPAAGPEFAASVVALFERLNARLRADLGPACQVGHSYFMVPELDEARLRVVWQHHVRPLLEEYFTGHPERAAAYELDALRGVGPRHPGGHKRRATAVPG